jgi:recombination protein RecA
MAKKKEKETSSEESESIKKIDLSSVIIDASFIKDNPKQVISISPAFDQGLHGGIPKGSFVIISGKEKIGKTYSIMHIVSKFLNQSPKSTCLYLDVEHRLKPFHVDLPGLPVDRVKVVRSNKGNLVAAEDFLTYAEQYVRDNADCIVILDSSSALIPRREQMGEISGDIRAQLPKILAHFCRRIGQILSVQDSILIMITHLAQDMNSPNPKYAAFKEDGGRKIQYHSDIKIKCKSSTDIVVNEEEIGKEIDWSVEWASLGAPGRMIKSWIKYGIGIDEVKELVEQAINLALIMKGGAWYTCDFMTEMGEEPKKIQGIEKLYDFLNSDPKYVESLRKQLDEMR